MDQWPDCDLASQSWTRRIDDCFHANLDVRNFRGGMLFQNGWEFVSLVRRRLIEGPVVHDAQEIPQQHVPDEDRLKRSSLG